MTEYRLKVYPEKIMNFQNFIHKSLNNENFDGYIQARTSQHSSPQTSPLVNNAAAKLNHHLESVLKLSQET